MSAEQIQTTADGGVDSTPDVAGVVVANAPVSYGAFEITVGIDPNVPDAVELLDSVAAAGYSGVDLGPLGYLGTGTLLAERLRSRGMGLAGGYLGLPFSEPDEMQGALASSRCAARCLRCGR